MIRMINFPLAGHSLLPCERAVSMMYVSIDVHVLNEGFLQTLVRSGLEIVMGNECMIMLVVH